MISADIFRGRYFDGFDTPKPIPANQKQRYRFNLPDANHVFLPGHRLMIQVQSSWFPLYDRNPQTYVSNIFLAKPSDYKKATIKVFDAGESASFVELPVGQLTEHKAGPDRPCTTKPPPLSLLHRSVWSEERGERLRGEAALPVPRDHAPSRGITCSNQLDTISEVDPIGGRT
jgi:hypothetical protein